jgi:hypothetical protein
MVVIVAEKVQETMKGQDPKLNRVGMAGLEGLTVGDPGRDDDVSQLLAIVGGERQDVRRPILSAVTAVQIPDSRVTDERDADLACRPSRRDGLQPLRQPGGAYGTAPSVRDGDPYASTVWIHRTIRTP